MTSQCDVIALKTTALHFDSSSNLLTSELTFLGFIFSTETKEKKQNYFPQIHLSFPI